MPVNLSNSPIRCETTTLFLLILTTNYKTQESFPLVLVDQIEIKPEVGSPILPPLNYLHGCLSGLINI